MRKNESEDEKKSMAMPIFPDKFFHRHRLHNKCYHEISKWIILRLIFWRFSILDQLKWYAVEKETPEWIFDVKKSFMCLICWFFMLWK